MRVHVIPLCGAVVGLTLGLIAHVVVVVFVVAILQRIFCIWRYTLYTVWELGLNSACDPGQDTFTLLPVAASASPTLLPLSATILEFHPQVINDV